MKIIKKYTNRRLYDTDQSQYITLEELAELIREGHDVKVIDTKEGHDLTQATLAQIVVESRGAAKMLPVPLLTQMIRMGDDALSEFMSLYMSWALQTYLQARQGFQGINPYQLFGGGGGGGAAGGFPFSAPGQALAQFFTERAPWRSKSQPSEKSAPQPEATSEPPPAEEPQEKADLASLREEIGRLTQRLDEMSGE